MFVLFVSLSEQLGYYQNKHAACNFITCSHLGTHLLLLTRRVGLVRVAVYRRLLGQHMLVHD